MVKITESPFPLNFLPVNYLLYILKKQVIIESTKILAGSNLAGGQKKMDAVKEPTILCELAYKYGTDKCPQLKHSYTPFYHELFKDRRESVKKVVEMGIGYYKTIQEVAVIYDGQLKRYYQKGASLKMWRDYFPNAQIYGADIAPETLIENERIMSFVCDETKEEQIVNLINQTGQDIDIFIDDGSHKWHHQAYLAKTVLPLLKKDVVYIIEDVGFPSHLRQALKEYECINPKLPYCFYRSEKYKGKIPKDRLFIVKNK